MGSRGVDRHPGMLYDDDAHAAHRACKSVRGGSDRRRRLHYTRGAHPNRRRLTLPSRPRVCAYITRAPDDRCAQSKRKMKKKKNTPYSVFNHPLKRPTRNNVIHKSARIFKIYHFIFYYSAYNLGV